MLRRPDLWTHTPLPLLALAAVLLVVFVHDPTFLNVAVEFCFFLLLSASWNLMAGFTGQISFAHVAFAVIGGYLTGGLSNWLDVSPLLVVPVAGLLTGVLGFALGALTLRFRDIFLALATFAFAQAFITWSLAAYGITGGSNGMSVSQLFDLPDQTAACAQLGVALVLVYHGFQALILRSRWGLFARATRDREDVARGLGVRTTRMRVLICAFAAFWAGIAGGFYGGYVGLVSPSMGMLSTMGLVLAMVVVGGMGSVAGPVLGTLLFRLIDFYTRGYGGQYTVLIFAALMLVMMLFARDGLVGLLDRAHARLFGRRQRWVAPAASAAAKATGAPR